MKRLLILCGLPFSGKSTLCGRLRERYGFRIVSFDAINAERGLPFGGDGLPPETWARTLEIALERLDAALAAGESAVVDDTTCFRWIRDRFRGVAAARGRDSLIVHLSPSDRELAARREEARRAGSRPPVRPEVWDALVREFEPPGPDEPAVTLATPAEVDGWLAGLAAGG